MKTTTYFNGRHGAVLILSILFCFSGCSSDSDDAPYIYANESKLLINTHRQSIKLLVSSNQDWEVHSYPDWCKVESLSDTPEANLEVTIEENETYREREGYIRITASGYGFDLPVFQKGVEVDIPMKFHPFLVNTFEKITPTGMLSCDAEAKELFVNPQLYGQMYLGNIVQQKMHGNCLGEHISHYNSITGIFMQGTTHKGQTFTWPYKDAYSQFVSKAIDMTSSFMDLCAEKPVCFNSYVHLDLLLQGNLGARFAQFVAGNSNTHTPMDKKVGMIYTRHKEYFRMVMDYPEEKPEFSTTIGWAYISEIAYGTIAFLIVKSDFKVELVDRVINKRLKNKMLSEKEQAIMNEMDLYCIVPTQKGTFEVADGEEIAINLYRNYSRKYVIPLTFSIRNFKYSDPETIKYSFSN